MTTLTGDGEFWICWNLLQITKTPQHRCVKFGSELKPDHESCGWYFIRKAVRTA